MPMGPDPNPNTASAIGPATVARLEHAPLKNPHTKEGEKAVPRGLALPREVGGGWGGRRCRVGSCRPCALTSRTMF